MRKLILIAILIIPGICFSQVNSPRISAAYLSCAPVDFGIGERIDFTVSDRVKIYESVTYGNWGLYKENGLEDHYRISLGMMWRLQERSFDPRMRNRYFYLTGAINYHIFNATDNVNESLNSIVMQPWSFELGVTFYVSQNVSVGVRTDIPRWEPGIDFGFRFNKPKRRR